METPGEHGIQPLQPWRRSPRVEPSAICTWQLSAWVFEPRLPDVQIVDIEYALDSSHGGSHVVKVDAPRETFKENIQGLGDDVPGGPHNQDADQNGECGVHPLPAGVAG